MKTSPGTDTGWVQGTVGTLTTVARPQVSRGSCEPSVRAPCSTVYHRTLQTLTPRPATGLLGCCAVSVGGVDTDPGSCCWKIAVNYLSLETFNADLSIKVFTKHRACEKKYSSMWQRQLYPDPVIQSLLSKDQHPTALSAKKG